MAAPDTKIANSLNELSKELSAFLKTLPSWDESAEAMLSKAAESMVRLGATKSEVIGQLVSAGIRASEAKRTAIEALASLGMPQKQGLAMRIIGGIVAMINRTPLVRWPARTMRERPRAAFATIAIVIAVFVGWGIYECTAYKMSPSERNFFVKIKAEYSRDGNPNGPANNRWLAHAASLDYVGVARYLLSNGADANVKSGGPGWWECPIHDAADPKMIRLLLAHGADVNARDSHGCTPLHRITSKTNNESGASALVEGGGDVNAMNDKKETPLDVAESVAVIRLLVRKGAKFNATKGGQALCLASASDQNNELVGELLGVGASPDDQYDGQRPIMSAVIGDAAANVETLLARGADPDVVFPLGMHAGAYLDVERARLHKMVGDWKSISDEKLREEYQMKDVGGMTLLQAAEAVGADRASEVIRKHASTLPASKPTAATMLGS